MLLDKTLVHYKYPSKKMGITGAITLYFSYTFWYYYRPHPKDGEGNVFSLSTLDGGGGGGYPYPIMLCNISQNAMGQLGGVPCQVQPGGVPCQVQLGGPWPGGYPARSSWGEPWPGGTLPGPAGGVPWPGRYSGRGGTQLGQHREYLLHSGQYASCVHAGGLSCIIITIRLCT